MSRTYQGGHEDIAQQNSLLLAFAPPEFREVIERHIVVKESPWARVSYLVARQVAPQCDPIVAARIAAGLGLCMHGLDLLDDVEDGDQTPPLLALGRQVAGRLAFVLQSLCRLSILSLCPDHLTEEHALGLLQVMTDALLLATSGQHLDIVLETRPTIEVSVNDCMKMVMLKSGTLMRMICMVSVQGVCEDDSARRTFAQIGQYEGVAQQLRNDCRDLYDALFTPNLQKTDIVRHKKTSPIVAAARRGVELFRSSSVGTSALDIIREEIIVTLGLSNLYHARAYQHWKSMSKRYALDPELSLALGFDTIAALLGDESDIYNALLYDVRSG